MKRLSSALTGVLVGVLLCLALESVAFFVFTYLTSRGVMHLEGWVGRIDYYFPIIAIVIFCALISLEIARNSRDFKRASVIMSIVLTLVLGANYLYFWWWWNNNLPQFFSFNTRT